MGGQARPRGVGVALVAALLGLVGAGAAGCGSSSEPAPRPAPARVAPVAKVAPRPSGPRTGPSDVAYATAAKAAVYPTPGAARPRWTLANPNEYGAPLVFLVTGRRPGWLRVSVPVRPNGSTGWLRDHDARVVRNDYALVVSRRGHHLDIYRDGRPAMRMPVGIGTSDTPTPGGAFYITELLRPEDPNGAYGPYAYGLSGYSDVIHEFNGGDGILGLHGTNDPSSVGRDVSHGCIRLRNADVLKLTQFLPLGTPITIVA